MAAERQEYLDVFRAFNNEFSKGDEKAANAHFDAEFVFARQPQPKQIDPAPIALPVAPALPPCPSAQLLISDVPANPEPRGGVGARLTRLQRVVAAARQGNATEATHTGSVGDTGGNSTADADGELPVSIGAAHGGALSMVLPRRIFDATRLAGRLPAVETSLLELRCSAYDLNPLGFPPLVGA